ncbi:DUF433 domain-containing protein [Amycolatopsis kentuckyensis]|uniref:DUF433 domain-containing protein n=1 Tax=Amycolatopsis kentuckyensis TaxID=218823 RepID=UPI0035618B96
MNLDAIVVSASVLDGLPCTGQAPVPVAVVQALALAGMTADEIVGAFPGVTSAGVQQALVMPAWMALPPGGLTAAQYDQLAEDVCVWIEVVDGRIVARR